LASRELYTRTAGTGFGIDFFDSLLPAVRIYAVFEEPAKMARKPKLCLQLIIRLSTP